MKLILVALDGSPRARAVLAQAIAIAQLRGARLFLMRSIGLPADIPQDLWRTTEEPLLEVLEQRAKAYLEQCDGEVPVAVRGGVRVVVGTPWQAICDTALEVSADLVVVGSHGYSGIDRLLGTTAAKVVNHAACSVLVVREPAGPGASPSAD